MLAYDDLKGSEGRKVWYRPPRYDATRLFPGRPPRVRLRTRSYLLQNISLGGVAAVSKDRRVLDVFCHTGGFGLAAAHGGAASVLAVDSSEPALTLARAAAEQKAAMAEARRRWPESPG